MKEIIKRNLKLTDTNTEEIEGKRYINGFIPYNSKSQRMYLGYSQCNYEILEPTVFRKTLGDKANVFANYSHDNNKILGSTKSGTLELTDTPTGLKCRCLVPNTTWGNDTWEIVSRGDVTTMSFEFYPYDYEEIGDLCHLRSAKLTAVSFAVSEPAYVETDSFTSFRSVLAKRSIDMDELTNALETGEVNDSVKNLAKALNDLVAKANENKSEVEQKVEETKTETATETTEQSKDIQSAPAKVEVEENPTEEQLTKLNQLCEEIKAELND